MTMVENQIESSETLINEEPLEVGIPNVGLVSHNTVEELTMELLALHRKQGESDVTFLVGEEKLAFPCHKRVMVSKSKVFEKMFSATLNSKVNFPATDPVTFEYFFEFIYGDKFINTAPDAVKLLELGYKYEVKDLVKKCEDLLTQDLKLENCIKFLKLAREYSLPSLMEEVENLMASSFVELSNEDTFRKMEEATIIYLLQRDDLRFLEVDLFNAVLRWAKDKIVNSGGYAKVLKNIIPLIRFPLMTAQEFTDNVIPTKILPQKDINYLFSHFYCRASRRLPCLCRNCNSGEGEARGLKVSSIPRKGPRQVELELYEAVDRESQRSSLMNIRTKGRLYYAENHEDILEIVWNPGSSIGTSHPCMKLASITLQGMDYDKLQSVWPYGIPPDSNYRTTIWIEEDYSPHPLTFSPHRNHQLLITKGKRTEAILNPSFEFQRDVTYRIVVRFEKALIIFGKHLNGNNCDIMTSSRLKTSLRDSQFSGSLNINMGGIPRSSSTQRLNVVRALKFVLD